MSAIQRTRNPYLDPERAFEDSTLIESGNEISIVQKIDLELGGYPDPNGTGDFKSVSVDYDPATRTFTMSSTAEAAKFKAGDEVVIYNEADKSRMKVKKNCVKSVSGVYVEMYVDVPALPDDVTIERNLVFRGSNLNCYRQDQYGIKRFYPAIAGVSEIESAMGEMFEYSWDRSDYGFTMDNYDKKFDPYMPGGPLYTTFALRDVNVWFGFGEETHKNRLVFSGVTNLNNGVSEEDEKIKITAYDISYLYNIPVALNTFPDTIIDTDYRGKAIPLLFGDYSTVGAMVGGAMKPIVPAILTRKTTTFYQSTILIPGTKLGVSSSLKFMANLPGNTYDGNQIEIIYSRTLKTNILPSCSSSSLGGGKTKWTVTLYRGKNTSGLIYSSTRWIKDCLMTNGTFASTYPFVTGHTNEQITEYKNYVEPYDNTNSTDTKIRSDIYTFGGGSNTNKLVFKICANGIGTNTGSYSFWSNKGSWDEPADWDSAAGTFGNLAVTNVAWSSDTGELSFECHASLTTADIAKQKVFVYVEGMRLHNASIKKDPLLLFNAANNTTAMTATDNDRSGNGAVGFFIGQPMGRAGGGFPLGGYVQIVPYTRIKHPGEPEVCESFLGTGLFEKCSGGRPTTYSYKNSWLQYNFKNVSDIGSQNFALEVQFTHNILYPTTNETVVGNTDKVLFAFGHKDGSVHGTPMIRGLIDVGGRFILDWQGTIIQGDRMIPQGTVFGVKVTKTGTNIRIYLKDISLGEVYTEVTYLTPHAITNAPNDDVNYIILGAGSQKAEASAGSFYGQIGMSRFRVGANAFLDEDFTLYGTQNQDSDIVSIARQVLQLSGADSTMFDNTWDNFYQDVVVQSYQARAYVAGDDVKTVDYAVELLGQIGIVLQMREDRGKIKFSLLWDSLPFYQKGTKKITAYDIEFSSVAVERELNQYFNTAKAEFNYNPAEDNLSQSTGAYYEPAAVERDGNLNIWFGREDKGFKAFEFPAIYSINDAADLLAHMIANSTPNTEMITCNLSWRHLMLQVGEFVLLNFGRYQNVPVQVRSIKLNANGSSIEVKFRSLESLNFIDPTTGIEYIPQNFDGVGGQQALSEITNATDEGDN